MMPADFDRTLAAAVREMRREPTVPATVDRVVNLATETIVSCDAAAVKVFEQGVPSVLAATDPGLQELLEEHMRLGSTPMVDVYRDRASIYVADLRRDCRWPAYGRALRQNLGLHTVYILPLAGRDKLSGVLGLYAKAVDGFDQEDKAVADILMAHAAAALADAVGQMQLRAALDSRTVIGQATGILMERFGLDSDAAFGALRRLSQTQNLKLRELAKHVVETGSIG